MPGESLIGSESWRLDNAAGYTGLSHCNSSFYTSTRSRVVSQRVIGTSNSRVWFRLQSTPNHTQNRAKLTRSYRAYSRTCVFSQQKSQAGCRSLSRRLACLLVDAVPNLHRRAISRSRARSAVPPSHYRRRYGRPWQYILKNNSAVEWEMPK